MAQNADWLKTRSASESQDFLSSKEDEFQSTILPKSFDSRHRFSPVIGLTRGSQGYLTGVEVLPRIN